LRDRSESPVVGVGMKNSLFKPDNNDPSTLEESPDFNHKNIKKGYEMCNTDI
jgi:hypothetical protein